MGAGAGSDCERPWGRGDCPPRHDEGVSAVPEVWSPDQRHQRLMGTGRKGKTVSPRRPRFLRVPEAGRPRESRCRRARLRLRPSGLQVAQAAQAAAASLQSPPGTSHGPLPSGCLWVSPPLRTPVPPNLGSSPLQHGLPSPGHICKDPVSESGHTPRCGGLGRDRVFVGDPGLPAAGGSGRREWVREYRGERGPGDEMGRGAK